uniref:Uncharacterized protein n=1 Tax=Timema genevievae TaxID=629358 RepID=A0A7R9JQF9_TIMGE|nr:unnamed protein product [Timema genevievae]
MEENTFAVKSEPENDVEYNLHQDAKLIMETELDMPIKSEVVLKEELLHNQQLEHGTNSISIPSIKEEPDVSIKSEVVLKEEVIDNQQLEYGHVANLPSTKEELDKEERELGKETRELMSTGGGPYKPHNPSCPEVEVVAPPH